MMPLSRHSSLPFISNMEISASSEQNKKKHTEHTNYNFTKIKN